VTAGIANECQGENFGVHCQLTANFVGDRVRSATFYEDLKPYKILWDKNAEIGY